MFELIECPCWQCSGNLISEDSNFSDKDKEYFGDNVDWQVPTFRCDDCNTKWVPVIEST